MEFAVTALNDVVPYVEPCWKSQQSDRLRVSPHNRTTYLAVYQTTPMLTAPYVVGGET